MIGMLLGRGGHALVESGEVNVIRGTGRTVTVRVWISYCLPKQRKKIQHQSGMFRQQQDFTPQDFTPQDFTPQDLKPSSLRMHKPSSLRMHSQRPRPLIKLTAV